MTEVVNSPAGRGACTGCNQNRVLWRFQPEHLSHWDEGARLRCPLCQAQASGADVVLLCLDCRTSASEEQEAAPLDGADAAVLRLVVAQSGPHDPTAALVGERQAS